MIPVRIMMVDAVGVPDKRRSPFQAMHHIACESRSSASSAPSWLVMPAMNAVRRGELISYSSNVEAATGIVRDAR